jgi:hypothetical protein
MEHVLSSLLPATARRTAASERSDAAPRSQESKSDHVTAAMLEAEEAIGAVIEGSSTVSLTPQDSYVRRLQHELADRYNLSSRSRGKEPFRRVEIYR